MFKKYLGIVLLSVLSIFVVGQGSPTYANVPIQTQETVDTARAKLVDIKRQAIATTNLTRSETIRIQQARIWALANDLEVFLRSRERDPMPPVVDPTRPRPPPVDPTPPTSITINTVKHSVWGEVAHYKNQTISNTEFGATGPTAGLAHAVLNLPVGELHPGVVFNQCRFIELLQPDGAQGNMRWNIRGFDLINPEFIDCEFKGKVDEHDVYLNNPQGAKFLRCKFDNPGAAAIQIAWRVSETIDANKALVESTTLLDECVFYHAGDPTSQRWGAFTVSFHPSEIPGIKQNSHIVIRKCQFIGGHLNYIDGNGVLVQSSRSFLVAERPSVTFDGTVIDCPNPLTKWAGMVRDTPKVTFVDTTIVQGNVEIKNATSGSILRCKGGAWVRIGTGPPGNEGLTNVIYEGPISNDFSWGQ